jgi:hypothetical protein
MYDGFQPGRDPIPKTTAKVVKDFHEKSDLDSGTRAQHHTLGYGPNQAARGSRLRELIRQVELSEFFDSVIKGTFMRRQKAAAQSIPDVTFTKVTFPNVVSSSIFLTVASDSEVTLVEDGIYSVDTFVTWAAGASGRRILSIRKNGTETCRTNTGSTTTAISQSISDTFRAVAGDIVTVEVNHNLGAALDVNAGALAIKRLA